MNLIRLQAGEMLKKELRQSALKFRESLNLTQISHNICAKIESMPEFQRAKNIAIFYPKNIEINLLELCKNKDKNFYLPKIVDNKMVFCEFLNKNDLRKGKFDIPEPISENAAKHLDIIITPALMADKKGYRLGWGGGFYDKYLQNFNGITICPVPDCQITDNLPCESYDKKCDFVVSEEKIIKTVD